MNITIKAIGDWELDVLGVPYGSPTDLDSDGQYFNAATKLHDDKFPLPPVVYYHGFNERGAPSGNPEYIGKTVSFEDRPDGRWYRVVLNKMSQYAQRIWEAAKQGMAEASSGSVGHLVRKQGAHITEWPVAELSLIDRGDNRAAANRHAVAIPVLKAVYLQAGLTLPELDENGQDQETVAKGATARVNGNVKTSSHDSPITNHEELNSMSENGQTVEKPVVGMTQEQVAAMLKAAKEQWDADEKTEREAEQARQEELETAKAEAVKAAKEQWDQEFARRNRLPYNGDNAPVMAKYANTWKYDNLNDGDLAVLIGTLDNAKRKGLSRGGVSENALKALAVRHAESTDKNHAEVQSYMKAAGMPMKANELNQSTLATYGDEWIGVAYSRNLWMDVVQMTGIVDKIPSIEVPQGTESITIPIEGTAPSFYKVAQASAQASNLGRPTGTVTSSKLGTGSQSLTVAKLGASTIWTGELEEDSLIPWAATLRAQMVQEGAEVLDHIAIDGDTATGATTNINDIAGTPGGTEAFLIANGFRKLALVTNTANSRSGGSFDETDFIETVKLLGLGGRNAVNSQNNVAFIADVHTYWKALQISTLQTRDVFANPTIENGRLVRIWGYDVLVSTAMHRANTDATYGYKANTSGKVDLDTAANNTTGSLLAVRWDQWLFGYKRRMTIETARYANSDANEIVAMMRVGMVYRDTDASAISYNLTV